MNKEKLDQLLASGAITQEEYDAMIQNITETPAPTSPPAPSEPPKPSNDDLEMLVQRAVDRATNKLGNENKALKERLEKLQNEKLTDEERRQLEIKERERALEEKERAVKQSENRLYALKAIKQAKLDDGSADSMELIDFVMGEDEEEINAKVKSFSALVNRFVKAQVDETFKNNGRNPDKGNDNPAGENPYKEESFNLTKQWELEAKNPELAKAMKAAAGIK